MSKSSSDETAPGWTIEQSLRQQVLLSANRIALAGSLAIVLFVLLLGFGTLELKPLREAMQTEDTIETLYQTLIAGLITGTTLVISINQLVLSQEFGSAGRQRERMTKSMDFRRDTEALFGEIGPPNPDAFLQSLVDATTNQARVLQEAVAENGDRTLRSRVDQFVERTIESADGVASQLESAQFGEFTVMRASLAYNYSWKIYVARRLRSEHTDSLSEEEYDAFDELIETLELFGPAGEFFKTHYMQWELVNLSRRLLYTAIPALFVAVIVAVYVGPATAPGRLFGIDNMVWLVSGTITLTLVPFFVFAAYVARIATLAKETGAIGPFVLHESRQRDLIDWDDSRELE